MKPWIAAPAAAALLLPLTACATDSGPESDPRTSVVAEIYPYAWIAEEVGGELVEVTTLVPPGTDVHSFEVSPKQVAEISDADLVILTDGVAAAVDEAVETAEPSSVVDAAAIVDLLPAPTRYSAEEEHAEEEHAEEDHAEEEHHHGNVDSHTWLAIDQMTGVVDAIAEALGEIDAEHADEFAAAASGLNSRLATLDEGYRTGLASCQRETIVVTHPAFGYIADAYGLDQLGISGFDEDTEPSPARIAEVGQVAQETGATTIYLANTSNAKVADVLASDLGLDTAVLFTLTSSVDGQDYIAMAEANLTALEHGLGCS